MNTPILIQNKTKTNPPLFETELLKSQKFTNWAWLAGSESEGSTPLSPQCWDYKLCHSAKRFYIGSGGRTQGLMLAR